MFLGKQDCWDFLIRYFDAVATNGVNWSVEVIGAIQFLIAIAKAAIWAGEITALIVNAWFAKINTWRKKEYGNRAWTKKKTNASRDGARNFRENAAIAGRKKLFRAKETRVAAWIPNLAEYSLVRGGCFLTSKS